MGKWALSPQTRINTGFLVTKSGFQKWAESGQMGKKLIIFTQIPPNFVRTILPTLQNLSQKWAAQNKSGHGIT